jgi:hypothetical protein
MLKTLKLAAWSTAGLLAAAAGPAIYYGSPNYWKSVKQEWSSALGSTPKPAADGAAAGTAPQTASVSATPRADQWEGETVRDLTEVLRFDVTHAWILQRWPRVSTGSAYLQLQGYRVPLVTGTAESDLAGSLTYYFGPGQEVQRIAFHGTTGDPRNLVKTVTTRFNFAHRPANDPSLFIYESVTSGGKPQGRLRIRSAGVVKASNAYQRFAVDLVMDKPS